MGLNSTFENTFLLTIRKIRNKIKHGKAREKKYVQIIIIVVVVVVDLEGNEREETPN